MTTTVDRQAGQEDAPANKDKEALPGMEELLADEEHTFRTLRRGDVIDGVVMRVSPSSILVDVGSKSEGVIAGNEMQSLGPDGWRDMKVGDEILVYVLQPENQEGQVVLSLDRAKGEKGWRVLQKIFESGEAIEAQVVGYNKGGLLAIVEGVHGFIPSSQVVSLRPGQGDDPADADNRLAAHVGENLHLKVIEINRRRNRLILSERAALQEWRQEQKQKLLEELKEGEIRRGKVTSIRDFGVFVDLGGIDGLAHLSELSWERVESPDGVVSVGEEVDVYVMKVDAERQRIALSLRRARPEEWNGIVDRYEVGQLVQGTISKLVNFGAFARIDGPVEGLIHVSELADRRVNHPREVVREGDVLTLKIVKIERDRHRLGLSLRQAQQELGES